MGLFLSTDSNSDLNQKIMGWIAYLESVGMLASGWLDLVLKHCGAPGFLRCLRYLSLLGFVLPEAILLCQDDCPQPKTHIHPPWQP